MYIFWPFRLVLLGVLLALPIIIFRNASADTDKPWVDGQITVQNEGNLASAANIPASINNNRDCVSHKFITRPLRATQTEVSHTACAVQTNYGLVDPSGWLEFNSTATTGKLLNYPGYSAGSIPIPNSSSLINYFSTGVGTQLYLNQNLPLALLPSTANSGEVTYKINSPAQISLRDRANSVLLTQIDTISFSGNGKWMVVDAKNRALLRVNLESFEVLPFAPSFNYNIGLDPSAKTAITSDGRYAVVYSKNFSTFKIYDLGTCGPVPNSINSPVTCQSKDLLPVAQQQIVGFGTISRVRFIDNTTLVFYASYQPAGQPSKIAKFRISSGEASATNLELLALGDSYISGEGIFDYKPSTDMPDNRCHLSVESYPYLASAEASVNSYQSVACSGARILHLMDREMPDDGATKPQAKNKKSSNFNDEIYSYFLPGYRAQIIFVEKYRPKNILVSVGGNDIGFSAIIKRCLAPDTCFGTYEDRLEMVRLVAAKLDDLVDTYSKIKEQAPPGAKVYTMGYPQIAQPNGDCAVNVRLNNQELEFSQQLTSYLNAVIKAAADKAGVAYINNENALDGYKLCETDSHKLAVNGLTAGDNTPSFLNGPIGNESYHPNKLGHQLLSQSLLGKSMNLTKSLPGANLQSSPPGEQNLELLNAPKSNRSINQLNYDDSLTNNMVYKEAWWDITLDGIKHSLLPTSPVKIVLFFRTN